MNNDKCSNCPINSKGQYLKNMVCKNNCPRENYTDPLDQKIIDLQQKGLKLCDELNAKNEKQIGEIKKELAEATAQTIKMAEIYKILPLFKIQPNVFPADRFAKAFNTDEPGNKISVDGIEFRIEPASKYTNIKENGLRTN